MSENLVHSMLTHNVTILASLKCVHKISHVHVDLSMPITFGNVLLWSIEGMQ